MSLLWRKEEVVMVVVDGITAKIVARGEEEPKKQKNITITLRTDFLFIYYSVARAWMLFAACHAA